MKRAASSGAETGPELPYPVRRTRGIESRQAGDELMVMDEEVDRVHVLNPTMAAIWKLCDGRRSAEQIAEALSEALDCSEVPDLAAVTRDALRSLAELDLVRPAQGVESHPRERR